MSDEDDRIDRRAFLRTAQLAGAVAVTGGACAGVASPKPARAPGRTDSFDVRSFGASGTGTHDDAAALREALAAGRGKRVVCPPGRYLFSRPLEVPPHTELELLPGTSLECAVAGERAGIVLGDGAQLRSSGGGAETCRVIARAGCDVDSLITNMTHDGTQEYCYVEGLYVRADTGARIASALVRYVSVFVNSGIRDCVIAGNGAATSGLRIEGGAKTGFGPVYVENVWVTRCREHNIVITEQDPHHGAATCWLANVTSEHQGSGFHGLYVRGFGGLFNVAVRNYHYEHGQPVSAPTAAICVDGVSGFSAENVNILSSPIEHKAGILITKNFRNVRTRIRNVQNENLVSPVLDDQLFETRIGPRNISFYEASNARYADQIYAGLVTMPGGVATLTKHGAISDADFGARVDVPDGTMAVDTAHHRLYVRVGGAWKFVRLDGKP